MRALSRAKAMTRPDAIFLHQNGGSKIAPCTCLEDKARKPHKASQIIIDLGLHKPPGKLPLLIRQALLAFFKLQMLAYLFINSLKQQYS